MARLEPSVALKDSEPVSELALRALYVMADSSGTLSSGRPIMLARSGGAASTTPLLSISSAEMPGRPLKLAMIFDSQSRLMPATATESSSGLIAETG
jgi:hypothetical protein